MKSALIELIEQLSSQETGEKPFGKRYFCINEEEYQNRYCDYRSLNGECPRHCQEECGDLKDHTEHAERVISAGNRVIDALIRDGCAVLDVSVPFKPYEIDYGQRTADIDYSAYTDDGFCRECRMLGSLDCPEDMLSSQCPRNSTAWAIERVADAVNELL